ncbi:MAG: glycosyltransferase family 39 protein, partial [Myxococcota bacterium]|nr:glycosyltransferase family 39 protein [Myxococcota bacterium]
MEALRGSLGVTEPSPAWPASGAPEWGDAEAALNLDTPLQVLSRETLDSELGPWMQRVAANLGTTVRFKDRGVVLTKPPLQTWLTSGLYRLFGVSETTSRFGNALLAWLTLLVVVWGVRAQYGDRVAVLSGLVLMTTPAFFLQGRSVVGEPGLMLGLGLAAVALLGLARESPAARVLCWLVPALVIAFLSTGLTGLLIVTVMVAGWSLVCGSRRIGDWTPALLCGVCLGLVALWVLTQSPDTFAGQFRFTQKLFTDGPTPYDRNFDWAIKRLGFGSLPWLGLGVIALAGLVRRATTEEDRSALAIVLWLLVPTVAVMGMLKDFNLALWPAAPAMAVAVALLLDQILRRGLYSPLAGLLLLGITFVLIRELGKDPQPIVDILAFDPPFAEKTGQRFPDDLGITRAVLLPTLGLVALALYHLMGLSEVARRLLVALRRPYVHRAIIAVGLSAVPISWIVMTADVLHRGMRLPAAKALSPEHRLFHQRFLLSLDPVLLLAAGGLVLLLSSLILGHLLPLSSRKRTTGRWLMVSGAALALIGALGLALGPSPWGWGGAGVALCALGGVLLLERPLRALEERRSSSVVTGPRLMAAAWVGLAVHMVASVSWPAGYWSETLGTFNHLLAFSGTQSLAGVYGAVLVGVVMAVTWLRRMGRCWEDCVLMLLALVGLWLGTRLGRDADLVTLGSVSLTLLGCLGAALTMLPGLRTSPGALLDGSGRLIAVGSLLLALPLLQRLGVVEHILYPDLEPGALRRNILWRPLLLVVPVVALVWVNRLIPANADGDSSWARLCQGALRTAS